jgi:hypothetical protein
MKEKNLPDTQALTKLMGDVIKIMTPIHKFCSAIGLRHMKALMGHAVLKLESFKDIDTKAADEVNQLAENLSIANEELWKIRQIVMKDCSELPYFEISKNKDLFKQILKG